VQGSVAWTPPVGTLGQIVGEVRSRLEDLSRNHAHLARAAAEAPVPPSLSSALRSSGSVSVIAEIKRRSPSKGWIRAEISAADRALAYEAGGAIGISVLTEPLHFAGSADDLAAVRAAVRIPVLKKDFHIEPIQLLEARACGASAALLIARALSPAQLQRMIQSAQEIGIEVVVEVRTDEELDRALDYGAAMIGVNNRNLETLKIAKETGERLVPRVPPEMIAIAESGVGTAADVRVAGGWGADAVLVGSTLSDAADPRAAVRALSGIPRRRRHG